MHQPRSEAEIRAANLYQIYMRSWRKGASTGLIEKELAEHIDPEFRAMWKRGYDDGVKARSQAATAICQELGHTPSILRTAEAHGAA